MITVASALEAVNVIEPGEYIWCHSMAATPALLLNGVADHAADCGGLTLMQLHLEYADRLLDESLEGRLRHRCFFAGRETRKLINEGRADYVPAFLSEIPKLFRKGEQRIDTALVQVSPSC